MKTYKIEPSGSSKIASVLCKLCSPGEIGESLIRGGCSQSAFSAFTAKLAYQQLVEKKKTAEDLALMFEMASAANASAAKQALADCDLYSEDVCKKDKEGNLQPITVETYWKSIGGIKQAPNLSIFD